MADANVASLQVAANRFAQITGFPWDTNGHSPGAPISVDGMMGPNTENAVLYSLQSIGESFPDQTDNVQKLIATADQQTLAASANGFVAYLNQNADYLGLPAGQAIASSSGGRSHEIVMPPMNVGSMSASLSTAWAKLPLPVKVGGGLALAIGAYLVIRQYMPKQASLSGFNGLGIDEESIIDVEADDESVSEQDD